MNPSLAALNALNFFMADVHGGLGPFRPAPTRPTKRKRNSPPDAL